MKKHLKYLIALLCAATLVFQGCTWIREHPKTAGGAGVGAAAGGLLGAVTEGEEGAVWGSVIGALAGAAVGAYMDHQDRTADETLHAYDYPGREIRVEAEAFDATPDTLHAGETVDLKAQYAVLTPRTNQQISVTEKRTVVHDGVQVGEATVTVARTTGTYTSTIPIQLPGTAEPGLYRCTLRLEADGQVSTLQDTFRVQ